MRFVVRFVVDVRFVGRFVAPRFTVVLRFTVPRLVVAVRRWAVDRVEGFFVVRLAALRFAVVARFAPVARLGVARLFPAMTAVARATSFEKRVDGW